MMHLIPFAAALAAAAVLAHKDALPNPGFESGMEGWTLSKGSPEQAVIVPEAAREGKAGLRVSDPSETEYVRVEGPRLPAQPGKTYRLEFWTNQLSGHGANVHFWFLDSAGEKIEPRMIAGSKEGATGWERFEIVAKAPANAAEVAADIQTNRVGVGVFYFDAFSLNRVE